jgi:hypothetical protein
MYMACFGHKLLYSLPASFEWSLVMGLRKALGAEDAQHEVAVAIVEHF